jgi:hypothetical protein
LSTAVPIGEPEPPSLRYAFEARVQVGDEERVGHG